MIFAIAIGALSAIVVLIVMARINLKKFMGYPATMDATVTVLLAWLLHGSYVGMVAAIIGGLVFSAMITVIRRYYGYSRLERRGLKWVWVDYDAELLRKLKHIQRKTSCINLKLSNCLPACIFGLFVLLCALL